jgi:small subunit ribosomal protein S11
MAKETTTKKEVKKVDAKVTPEKKETAPDQKVTPGGAPSSASKKRLDVGVLYVQSTYNNTKLLLTDTKGNAIFASSAGALGFKGAKKGTPFAAAKVGETLAAKAQPIGLKEVSVVVKGTGSGRESSIRGFVSKGILISSIKDETPVPFNGPKPKKPRRV